MDNGARIKINRETGEIEISGSEKFVNQNIGLVQSVLNTAPAKEKASPEKQAVAKPTTEKKEVAKLAPVAESVEATETVEATPVKRGRGRPKKTVEADAPTKTVAKKPAKTAKASKTAAAKAVTKPAKVAKSKAPEAVVKEPKIASSFSTYMKSFKRKMKKGDWILAAGYYFQTSTGSDTFSTFNTSKLLKSQGVELANPSQYMKNNVSSGRIEIVGKRSYNVTNGGKNHLSRLMTKK